MKTRTLYECSHARINGDRICCRKGHSLLPGARDGTVEAKLVERGDELALSVCQICPDFNRIGPPLLPYERAGSLFGVFKVKQTDVTNMVEAFDRVLKVILDENLRWMDAILRDSLNQESFYNFVTGMGIDMSHVTRQIGRPGGYDPYRVLGLEKTVGDTEVKKRYRELLHKLHPDTAGVKGTEFLLQMVHLAFEQIAKERGW